MIQRVENENMKKVQRDAKGTVILTEDKSDAGKSLWVLSHRDSGSFRTNELAVDKMTFFLLRSSKV